ncbi:dethiobiotin synthase [Mucilaginibacter sp. HMF5004]|uniref:dethiobiotin synthase n=1 Tax=Mucilaginibacter rivuli TaxID=2857527 RepID=UPI001C5D0653|nr:dethiobiotin synthase [Mucilaginibacter rivuli]MBW4889528.1 dethiobiotin synthase [Mucilaginibacter rivuli]
MDKRPIFVTGIGTGIGKTIVSAILVEKLQADYWKPVQAGDLEQSDTISVKNLVSNSFSYFHPEAYRLTQPYSPHKAADLDGIDINLDKIIMPKTSNQLIIEGAGGLMVPLNSNFLMIDLIERLSADVVLVSRNYLGSINHTLLSVEALQNKRIKIKALVFNGPTDEYSEDVIIKRSKADTILHIPDLDLINKENILNIANGIKWQ